LPLLFRLSIKRTVTAFGGTMGVQCIALLLHDRPEDLTPASLVFHCFLVTLSIGSVFTGLIDKNSATKTNK
jgi:hypothetical protein